MIRNKLRKAAGAVCAVGMAASTAQAAGVLEEVVVTAQLRAQSLQDVPVSVNAVSGDKMMEAGLDKIEDLQAYVPNLTMSETGIGTNIYIRGIGSGINQGFEQSVGMYFDGVYYGRAQLSRAPFLDLERVEVLRGPQNILYGKNSIAGALSLISRRPGQEFEGSVALTYEPEHGEEVYDLILSGPVNDVLGARFAVRHKKFDGYIENLTLDRDEPNRDETTARLILDWAANDRTSVVTKFEVGSFDVTGRQIEILNESPSTSSTPFFTDKTYAEILDDTSVPGLVTIDEDSSVLNNTQDFKRSSNGDFSNNDTQNITVNVDYALDNGGNMTFITGYLAYEYEELCDCDFTGGEVFKLFSAEEYSQFSQEFRYVSPVGETFEFITGAYYQTSDLEFYDSILITSDVLPQLINLADNPILRPPTGLGNPQDGFGDAGDEIANLGTPRDFTTDTELASVFLQTTWNISDVLRMTVGGRYTYEIKEGSRRLELTDNRTGEVRPVGEVDTVVAKNFKAERHNLEGERKGGKFAPSLNIQWDVNDMMMAYTTISKGFKSGGFDARSNASPGDENVSTDPAAPVTVRGSFEFEEEEALSFELGAKSTWLEGALELNAALFYTQYTDLQVSIFDGTLGFNVGNAAEAVTMGLELDGRYAVTEKIIATYAIAFMDFEFQDFTNGQCFQNQEPDSPTDPTLCDYDGKTNQYVADYSGNVGFVYTDYITSEIEFRGGLDLVFTGDYNPTQNLDPRVEQEAYVEYNARLALSNVAQGWEVALVGKNLTDETIRTYQNDTPLANSIFDAPSYYAFMKRPRSVALSLNYRF